MVDGGVVPRLLREYDNLYADLSAHSGYNALKRDPAFARKFLDNSATNFCTGRIIFSWG